MKTNLLFSLASVFFPIFLLHAAEDKPAWQVEWEKSVQAAKKEGQLVNYGGEEITHPEILKAFNKDYPEIKVTTAGGHGSELGARILAERRADHALPRSISQQCPGPDQAAVSLPGDYRSIEMVHR
jgi:hypothetical protein